MPMTPMLTMNSHTTGGSVRSDAFFTLSAALSSAGISGVRVATKMATQASSDE